MTTWLAFYVGIMVGATLVTSLTILNEYMARKLGKRIGRERGI